VAMSCADGSEAEDSIKCGEFLDQPRNKWPLKNDSDLWSLFLISNFCRVLYVVCFLLGNFPASEFYMPTFRNTLFHLHRQVGE
jgi:hypothetical protein